MKDLDKKKLKGDILNLKELRTDIVDELKQIDDKLEKLKGELKDDE